MATKFQTLIKSMPPQRRARVRARTEELLATLPLNGLRKARSLSQEELAEILDLNQASVSKLERRTDMYISTMRRFVRAMGGELEIRARFPEGVVEIDQFGALPDAPEEVTAVMKSGRTIGMAPKKVTRKKAAAAASKTLKSGATGKKSKAAAGSALSQRKAPKKTTGKKAASAASKTLRDGRTSKTSKSAAGSALAQRPGRKRSTSRSGTKTSKKR